MKLIAEYMDHNLESLEEKQEDGKKSWVIEGIFAQAEQKNKNGRIYTKDVMEKALKDYMPMVKSDRAVGELNHPDGPTVNPERVSHKINALEFVGNDVMGKATILNTPMGQIVKGLLEGGVKLGVSTRGMGSLMQNNGAMYVKEDFALKAIDIVQDPSAPSAFVNGIMEGVDWVWNNGIKDYEAIEKMKTEIKNTSRKNIAEVQAREFSNFLSLIKNTY